MTKKIYAIIQNGDDEFCSSIMGTFDEFHLNELIECINLNYGKYDKQYVIQEIHLNAGESPFNPNIYWGLNKFLEYIREEEAEAKKDYGT